MKRVSNVTKKIGAIVEEMRKNKLGPPHVPHFLSSAADTELVIGHLNICYFLPKIQDICSDAEAPVFKTVAVMCFTETYLTSEHNVDRFLTLYNFQAFRLDIPSISHHQGKHGLMVCVKDSFDAQLLPVIQVNGLESLVVRITLANTPLIVCLIYRTPQMTDSSFVLKITELMSILPLSVPTIILGDFNDNVVQTESSQITRTMEQFGFQQYVKDATTDYGTLIDHIYFNKNTSDDIGLADVYDCYYSDHDATFFTMRSHLL